MTNEKVNKILRTRKMLHMILDWDSDCCYWDDEKNDAVIEGTKEDLYNYIMKDDEMHLLGTEYVKSFINYYFDDYRTFEGILRGFKAY